VGVVEVGLAEDAAMTLEPTEAIPGRDVEFVGPHLVHDDHEDQALGHRARRARQGAGALGGARPAGRASQRQRQGGGEQ